MAGSPDPIAAARTGLVDRPLPAGARAVLRWLPTAEPSGAFAGHHDQAHFPEHDIHSRVCLWWRDTVVHPGDRVGPPRGGMVPGPSATYAVALPAGGYIWVRDGVVLGWHAQSMSGEPLIRADGQHFEPGRYSVLRPYFRRHYDAITVSALRASLQRTGGEVSHADLSRVLGIIASARDPVICSCNGGTRTCGQSPLGLVVPESLLADTATLQVLVGEADAAEAAATLWRLTTLIWDPVQVGRAQAAESVARLAGEHARGWPRAPITEQAVAHIAAQAIRHLGAPVVKSMPAWLLGWVMVAKPVIASVEPRKPVVSAALEAADRVRVARVETQWQAMASARLLLERSSAALNSLDDLSREASAPVPGALVDVRNPTSESRPDRSAIPVAGMPLSDTVRLVYRTDVRSWLRTIADRTSR